MIEPNAYLEKEVINAFSSVVFTTILPKYPPNEKNNEEFIIKKIPMMSPLLNKYVKIIISLQTK